MKKNVQAIIIARCFFRKLLNYTEDFSLTDQINRAGNQLGTYQLDVQKFFPWAEITFYLSHPFEDLSGVNWRNWPDNLIGLYIEFQKEDKYISGILYEFTDTRQQSIRDERDREPNMLLVFIKTENIPAKRFKL